ncbi:MAG: hypothetical protein IPJ43_21050 [Saprospiraceae bacterium]|nr:hypothetical protein [Saprospiraceae bacterium]
MERILDQVGSWSIAPRWSMTAHYGSLGYDSVKHGDADAAGTFGLDFKI